MYRSIKTMIIMLFFFFGPFNVISRVNNYIRERDRESRFF